VRGLNRGEPGNGIRGLRVVKRGKRAGGRWEGKGSRTRREEVRGWLASFILSTSFNEKKIHRAERLNNVRQVVVAMATRKKKGRGGCHEGRRKSERGEPRYWKKEFDFEWAFLGGAWTLKNKGLGDIDWSRRGGFEFGYGGGL